MQDVLALLIVAAAVVGLAVRHVLRRRAKTCCGARSCPAARQIVERFGDPVPTSTGRGAKKVP